MKKKLQASVTGKSRRKGPDTRQRLLEAGVEVFARFGPEEVGIRRLAAAAGANSAALSYYFGGKEGYYRAVLHHLVQWVNQSIHDAVTRAKTALGTSPEPEHARKVLRAFVREVAETVLTKPQAEAVAAIVWRELLRPSSGFDIVYKRMIRPVHEMLTELVAAGMATKPSDPDAVLLAHTLWGQVAIFRLGFHVLRRRLKLRGHTLSKRWIVRICATIDAVATRLLASP